MERVLDTRSYEVDSGPLSGSVVLVVDDDEDIRTFLLALFADHGAGLCEAADGDEALEMARSKRPDLITLDLSMPGVAPDAVDQAPGETHPEEVLTEKDMRELQKANIIRALNQANWKVSGKGGAAELLGVKPTTLADRIRTYKIKRPSR